MAGSTNNSADISLVQGSEGFIIIAGDTGQEAQIDYVGSTMTFTGATDLGGNTPVLTFQAAAGVVALSTDLTGTTATSGSSGASGSSGSSGTSGALYFTTTAFTGTALTLSNTNTGQYIRTTNASPITISIITESTNPFDANSEIMVEQGAAGQVTFSANTTTINSPTTLKTRAQYSVVGLKRVSSGTWTLFGDTEN